MLVAKRLFFAILVALPLSACRKKSLNDEFPIGLFAVEDPATLETVRDAGFTAIQSYTFDPSKLKLLAEAARHKGLKTLLSPQQLMQSTVSVSGFPVLAWYLQDEPDVNGVSPQSLAEFERKVKAWDPGRNTAFVVGHGSAASRYADIGDAIMVDWYPVPHLPLASAGEHVRMTVEAAKGKPVWAVLQAMDWSWYPSRDPSKPRIGRFPDIYEMRFMSYHAVLEGARGLWYFAFTMPGGRPLLEMPELWFAVSWVTREMAAMQPIFQYGKPIGLPFSELPRGMLAKAWRWRLRDYVVVANARNDASLRVPDELLKSKWRPLFEVHRDISKFLINRYGAHYMKPFQVLVMESRPSLH